MKLLVRDFTTREKVLLAILGVILVVLVYYQFVDQPVRSAIANAESEKAALEIELTGVEARVATLEQMQAELSGLGRHESMMASYNNSQAELALLNEVLSDAVDYSVSFSDVTRDGDLIRRNFTLRFTAKNYGDAEQIIAHLTESEYRCMVADMRCSVDSDGASVTVDATATFYETMVGGVADAGLPADASAATAAE